MTTTAPIASTAVQVYMDTLASYQVLISKVNTSYGVNTFISSIDRTEKIQETIATAKDHLAQRAEWMKELDRVITLLEYMVSEGVDDEAARYELARYEHFLATK